MELSDGCNFHCGGCNDDNSKNCENQEVGWHEVFYDNKCIQKDDCDPDTDIDCVVCNKCDKYQKCDLVNEFFEIYNHTVDQLERARDNNKMVKKVDLNKNKDFTFSSYVRAGEYIYTSHIGGITDDEGNTLSTLEEQTEQTLINLKEMLKREDADLNDVINITVYMRDLDGFRRMRKVYRDFFTEGYPARMTATTDFIEDDCLIMVVAVAYKSE